MARLQNAAATGGEIQASPLQGQAAPQQPVQQPQAQPQTQQAVHQPQSPPAQQAPPKVQQKPQVASTVNVLPGGMLLSNDKHVAGANKLVDAAGNIVQEAQYINTNSVGGQPVSDKPPFQTEGMNDLPM